MNHDMNLGFFDPTAEARVVERRLPHWTQPGVVTFITFRTHDSMPREVVQQWVADRDHWLIQHGVTTHPGESTVKLTRRLPLELQREFRRRFAARWHDELDHCHGECALKQPELGAIVASSLEHFDGDRYLLTDYVVMPNHVHLLCTFEREQHVTSQCESWKKFTATQINRYLKRRGRFWQQDAFDHLVRSEEQFQYLQNYIWKNPERAGLRQGEYFRWSRRPAGGLLS